MSDSKNNPEYDRLYGRTEQRRDAGLETPPGLEGFRRDSGNSGCLVVIILFLAPITAGICCYLI